MAAAANSPRRAVQTPASPPPEEALPAPKLSRGLAGRTLTKPSPAEPQASAPSASATQPLPSIERIELDELRTEVERLRSSNETLRAEHLKLTSQVHELQNQNAQLIEDHTRDHLSIKAKETQLVRARSDAESAEQQASSLQREVERLKRELGRIGRAASPRASDVSAAADIFPSEDPAAMGGLKGPSTASNRHTVMSPTLSAGKENNAPNGYAKETSLTRAGSNISDGPYAISSPRQVGTSSRRPPSQPPPAYNTYNTSNKGHTASYGSSHSGAGVAPSSESEARSSMTSTTSARGRESAGSRPPAGGEKGGSSEGGVESWKRAAEVTQNLKARIELMKARQQQSMHR